MTIMQNFFHISGVAAVTANSQSYTTSGTYTWKAPAGVTKVSVVAVGGGGASGLNTVQAKWGRGGAGEIGRAHV